MKPYPTYKYSGIEWIGEIPERWTPTKLKHLAEIKGRIGWRGLTTQDYVDDGVVLLGVRNISDNNELLLDDLTRIPVEKYEESPEIQIKLGDVLLAKTGATIGKSCCIDEILEPMTVNAAVNIFRPNNKIIPIYFNYLISSKEIQEQFWSNVSENARGNLFQRDIREIRCIYPPYKEQEAIITFLSHKLFQIKNLIKQKQKQIELLKDERTSIINQAVTRGLNPAVPMRKSSIEWLGEVPEHWNIKKLKYLVDQSRDKKEAYGSLKVALENIESWTGKLVNLDSENVFEAEGIVFDEDDILFGKLRPYLAKVHKAQEAGICVSEILVLKHGHLITSDFLYYRCMSEDFIKEVNSSTYGAKMPRANWDFIGNLLIPYPLLAEQKAIADWINTGILKSNKLIEKVQNQISLLQEYRTALISNAVMGKIDVRNYH